MTLAYFKNQTKEIKINRLISIQLKIVQLLRNKLIPFVERIGCWNSVSASSSIRYVVIVTIDAAAAAAAAAAKELVRCKFTVSTSRQT